MKYIGNIIYNNISRIDAQLEEEMLLDDKVKFQMATDDMGQIKREKENRNFNPFTSYEYKTPDINGNMCLNKTKIDSNNDNLFPPYDNVDSDKENEPQMFYDPFNLQGNNYSSHMDWGNQQGNKDMNYEHSVLTNNNMKSNWNEFDDDDKNLFQSFTKKSCEISKTKTK